MIMRRGVLVLPVFIWLSLSAPAAEPGAAPFRYPEATHGKGRLRYINDLPVLEVEGTPEEIGDQVAVLALKPAARLMDYPKEVVDDQFVNAYLSRKMWAALLRKGNTMVDSFPKAYRKELEAMAKAGVDRDKLVAANTIFDMKNIELPQLLGCSSLMVDAAHSKTRGPLFGHNLDFYTLGYLQEYSLVTVYRPSGKGHVFASVGFPGFLGCLAGMNDAGLSLASHEVLASTCAKKFNPKGVPFALCYRRVLEECTTVDEAFDLLQKMERTTVTNLVVCDSKEGAVFEVTPEKVVKRSFVNGLCVCTNHFCTRELANPEQPNWYRTLDRFKKLAEAIPEGESIGLAEIRRRLNAVNQGDATLQTMIFEPTTRKLHLAIGKCPSSALELKEIELTPLFERAAKDK
jgi:isopenicillin-N N-acyltransferase like protein